MRPESIRILVVDDDSLVLQILRDILILKGYQTTVAADGKEALNIIGKESFDVVLTDLGMPDVDGWVVAGRVKEKSPRTPVILITGWGAQLVNRDLSDKGVDLVLEKPINMGRLFEAIESVLGASSLFEDQRAYRRLRGNVGSFVILTAADNLLVARVGELTNISLGGLSFEYLPRGEQPMAHFCQATILIHNGPQLSKLPCKVVYDIEVAGRGTTRRCGVKFGSLDEGELKLLDHILSKHSCA